MQEDKKPTIYVKTASSACPDIVGDWAAGQKNPNESVKYLIIQLAAHFGNTDIFDPAIINTLNAMLTRNQAERMQLSIGQEDSSKPVIGQEIKETPGVTAEKDPAAKKKTEPIANKDIVELKFVNDLNSKTITKSETAKTDPPAVKEKSGKGSEKENEETVSLEAAEAEEPKEEKEEKAPKKKVARRPGTASNIMQ
ncbi:hypothetical protein RRU94_04085 [Domibacillus sp. DTU_2020_1001157_1_SI_ALB_TIR_016]|uniref:hypothetical protein n=1 Tax=Domibacillus sp. DTU_2020_1001157_1_SI_ALB_TIR_016 TaxID=3077789 RepID=UPI0028E26F83|nr:hypothetical protein [Domibacillus sp. DTU_2020_1001157_1_SI_ALB_TIR_016]WNS77697.1 hypothetical protein RRU94_04085 [Domibacillus sp. DTU_2020_1001157_1_SI_ALB_TIR_016]